MLDLNADRYLGRFEHQGVLAAGAEYTRTAEMRLPVDASLLGGYYVFVVTDPKRPNHDRGAVFEDGDEQNNAGHSTFQMQIERPPPSDLVASGVTASMRPDGRIDVTWTVANDATEMADGPWTDAVYLSADATWDIGDVLVKREKRNANLLFGALNAYTTTVTADLPPLKAGNYRVIVRPDIFNEVYEAAREDNNFTTSSNPISVNVPQLQLGVAQDLTLDTGEIRVYRVIVPEGETLRVRLTTDRRQCRERDLRALRRCAHGLPVRCRVQRSAAAEPDGRGRQHQARRVLRPGARLPGAGKRHAGAHHRRDRAAGHHRRDAGPGRRQPLGDAGRLRRALQRTRSSSWCGPGSPRSSRRATR